MERVRRRFEMERTWVLECVIGAVVGAAAEGIATPGLVVAVSNIVCVHDSPCRARPAFCPTNTHPLRMLIPSLPNLELVDWTKANFYYNEPFYGFWTSPV
jgi:hypothetical protein